MRPDPPAEDPVACAATTESSVAHTQPAADAADQDRGTGSTQLVTGSHNNEAPCYGGSPPTHWSGVGLSTAVCTAIEQICIAQAAFKAGGASPLELADTCLQIARESGVSDWSTILCARVQLAKYVMEGSLCVPLRHDLPDRREFGNGRRVCPINIAESLLLSQIVEIVDPSKFELYYHDVYAIPKPDGGERIIDDLRDISAEVFIECPSFVMPSVGAAFAEPDIICATKLDIEKAYFNCPLTPSLRRFFAIHLPDGRSAVFRCLPQGWSWSSFLFDLTLAPVSALLRLLHIAHVRYADDFLILGTGVAQLENSLLSTVRILRRVNLAIAGQKLFSMAATRIDFIGHTIDFPTIAVRWTPQRLHQILPSLQTIAADLPISLCQLQSIIGRLAFLSSALPLLSAHRRPLERELTRRLARGQRAAETSICQAQARSAATFWLQHAHAFAERWWPLSHHSRPLWRAETDASAHALGIIVYPPKATSPIRLSVPMSVVEQCMSSGAREALCLQYAVSMAKSAGLQPGDEIAFQLDATVAVAAVMRGAAKAVQLVDVTTALLKLILEERVVLRAHHVPRAYHIDADAQSRILLRSDAQLTQASYERVVRLAGFTPQTDLCAWPSNTKCASFVSPVWVPGAASADVFTAPIFPFAYAFPPFSIARQVTRTVLARYAAARAPLALLIPTSTRCPTEIPISISCFSASDLEVHYPPYTLHCPGSILPPMTLLVVSETRWPAPQVAQTVN